MKTTLKLIALYFVLQLLASFLISPCVILYTYITSGTLAADAIDQGTTMALAMLLSFVLMGCWLQWGKGVPRLQGRDFSPVSRTWMGGSLLAGIAAILLIDYLTSALTFLPNWMEATFNHLQSDWLGIFCITMAGPVIEELWFRGAITRVLLHRYTGNPTKAILISGLIFGLIHINPVQVVGACLSGVLFAWLYYKSGSLLPGIVLHILNNSISVWFMRYHPEVDGVSQLMDGALYVAVLILAAAALVFALRMLQKQPTTPIGNEPSPLPFTPNENPENVTEK